MVVLKGIIIYFDFIAREDLFKMFGIGKVIKRYDFGSQHELVYFEAEFDSKEK